MTFADFVAQIQTEVNDTTTRLKTLIEKWTNEEHSQICSARDWRFLVAYDPVIAPLTLTPATVPFTTLTKRILGICDVTDGSEYPLEFTTIEELRNNYPSYSLNTGNPECWYYSGFKQVSLWPALSGTRLFTLSYTMPTPILASGSTTALRIPDEFISVLTHKVLSRAWKYKTDERWQTAERDYALAWKEMCAACAADVKIQYQHSRVQPERLPRLSADS